MTNYIPTIGIEVHVELKTKTKIFSPSTNGYGEMANSLTNVIDLGYQGTLPTLNKEVVNLAIKAATVLNCKIRREMHFDRKNYFYPDNSKNYQITQSRTPIGYDGYVEIDVNGAAQIRSKIKEAISVFIMPPSLEILKARLSRRGTETTDVIEKRIAVALGEIARATEYDYIVVNDDLSEAVNDFSAIITADRLKIERPSALVDFVLNK